MEFRILSFSSCPLLEVSLELEQETKGNQGPVPSTSSHDKKHTHHSRKDGLEWVFLWLELQQDPTNNFLNKLMSYLKSRKSLRELILLHSQSLSDIPSFSQFLWILGSFIVLFQIVP